MLTKTVGTCCQALHTRHQCLRQAEAATYGQWVEPVVEQTVDCRGTAPLDSPSEMASAVQAAEVWASSVLPQSSMMCEPDTKSAAMRASTMVFEGRIDGVRGAQSKCMSMRV